MFKEGGKTQKGHALGYVISGGRPLGNLTDEARIAGEQRALGLSEAETAARLAGEQRATVLARKEAHIARISDITFFYNVTFQALAGELIRKKHSQDRISIERRLSDGGRLLRAGKKREIQTDTFDVYDTIGDNETCILPMRMRFGKDRAGGDKPIRYTQLLQSNGKFDDKNGSWLEVNFRGEKRDVMELDQVALHLVWDGELTHGIVESLPSSPRYDSSLLYSFFQSIPHMANSLSHFVDITLSLPERFNFAHSYYPAIGKTGQNIFEENCTYGFDPFAGKDRFRPVHSSITNLQPSSYIDSESHGGTKMRIPVWNPIAPNPVGHDGYSEKSYQNLVGSLLGLVHFQ